MYARNVVMVRPNGFGFNPETASSNRFMHPGDPALAMSEFEGLVGKLREAGVGVEIWEGAEDTPDAVFVNNWISSHEDGRVVIYPMRDLSRSRERDILPQGFREYPHLVNLSGWEHLRMYLEGTGSLVLDRELKIVYACRSVRTHPAALQRWADLFGYWPYLFVAKDREGKPIYHTNVVLSVGSDWAVICMDACLSAKRFVNDMRMDGKQVIEITFDQLEAFCGNVIELEGVIVASARAWDAFSEAQRAILARGRTAVIADVSTIETVGGGSVRCMIAEWFV